MGHWVLVGGLHLRKKRYGANQEWLDKGGYVPLDKGKYNRYAIGGLLFIYLKLLGVLIFDVVDVSWRTPL